MSKLSFGYRSSMGRQSLAAEPLRVRNNGDSGGGPSGANDKIRQSAKKKSSLPRSSVGASAFNASKRQSSGYGRGIRRTDVAKDPRPLSDKGYQHRSIKRLVDFLLENGYRHAVSTKLLQSPQSKDFFRIFEFLYGHFNNQFKIGSKPEEQIPSLLKTMGYPFNITKSSLFTIGTPHTWPQLLATLTWLVDLIQNTDSITDIESTMFRQEEEEGWPMNRIMFNYVSLTYAGFLQGNDTYEEEDEELEELFKANMGGSEGLEKLTSDYERLSQELELLEQNPDKISKLQEDLDTLKADNHTYIEFISQLQEHSKDEQQLAELTEEERLVLAAELKASQENIEAMNKIVETQKFSASDVERIRQSRMENQRQIDSVEKEIESTDSDVWALEMEMGKKQEQVEGICRTYNKLAQKHKLIPSNAEYAKGRDLEMTPSFTMATSPYDIIKPVLQDLKLEFKGKATRQAQARISSIDSLEEINELLARKQEDVSLKEIKLKRVEEDLNWKKELSQKELSSHMKQLEDAQTELSQMRTWDTSDNSSGEDLKLHLQQTKKQMEEQKVTFKKKEDEYVSFLTEYTQIVLAHKQSISEGIQQAYVEMENYAKSAADRYEDLQRDALFDENKGS